MGVDDEENKPVTQIPLLGSEGMNDLVFDATLPLKGALKGPHKKVKTTPPKRAYSPVYDPDTIDLFNDPDELNLDIDDNITEELRHNADEVIDHLVDEFTAEIGLRLREELTTQLGSILQDLHHHDTLSEKQKDEDV